jgi:phospholipase/carboxylesterase
MSDGGPLVYWVRPPLAGGTPAPTLVLMHGFGADEHDLEPLGAHLDGRLQLVFLRAPDQVPHLSGFQWYTFAQAGAPEPSSWERAQTLLRDTLDHLRQTGTVREGGLFLGGFSQGGVMTAGFLARHPDYPLAGAIILSGYLPPSETIPPLGGLPIFCGHGDDDPVVPVTWGVGLARRLEVAGARVECRTYRMAHGISPEELADMASFLRPLIV